MSKKNTKPVYSRGEYRSFAVAMIDGPDFQDLTPDAKLVLLVTRLGLGLSGIDVIPAFVAATAERTGLTEDRVETALRGLTPDWLQVEGSVVWIVRALEFEPNIILTNKNHVEGVRKHLSGLPRRAIVRRFMEQYKGWKFGINLAPYPGDETVEESNLSPIPSEGDTPSPTPSFPDQEIRDRSKELGEGVVPRHIKPSDARGRASPDRTRSAPKPIAAELTGVVAAMRADNEHNREAQARATDHAG